jgi:glycosyltransferase involved in cell wall biosynthesis
MRGGEWVLHEIAQLFPDAAIYTLVHRRGSVIPELEQHEIRTSWLQALSFGGRKWRYLLPLMPAAIEMFTFANADLVISTSHCVAKGVIPPPGAYHLSYIHTPMRYAWDQRSVYLATMPRVLHPILEARLARLRQWDMVSSARVDRVIANSRLVAWRIRHYWNRQAEVLPPPIDTEFFTPAGERGDGLLTVAALVPYKRVEVAMEVAHRLGRPLEVIGTGPMYGQLKRLRRRLGADTRFLGCVSREEVRAAYRRAAALIVPNIEDFGITTVESLACGTPVVGLSSAGTADTVRSGIEGELAQEPTTEAMLEATGRALGRSWDPDQLRRRALVFSRERFTTRFRFLVDRLGFDCGKAFG